LRKIARSWHRPASVQSEPLSREQALFELLLSLYDDDRHGLIRFVQFGEQGQELAAKLPGAEAPLTDIVGRAVIQLRSQGLVDMALFTRLEREFPLRVAEIGAVRTRWGSPSRASNAPRPVEAKVEEPFGALLSDAEARRLALREAGEGTTAVDTEILELKRKVRQGHVLGQGTTLKGRYWLLDQIGAGGFGTVWRARDNVESRIVAIKILHPQEARDTSKRERFFRGARAMRRLDHPAIVRIYEAECSEGDLHFFVMEHVDGVDLDRTVREKLLTLAQVVPIVVEIGKALARAHELGMVHRDVKPSNIVIDRQGRPRLTDFDLVRADDTTGGTRQGGMGTFVYSAPEMYEDANRADARADVFGLGMTAVFAFFGHTLPVEVLRDEREVFARLRCSPAVKQVLLKAIQWTAAARYTRVREFCDALAAAASLPEPQQPDVRRQSREVVVLSIVAAAVLAMVLVIPYVSGGGAAGDAGAVVTSAVEHREPAAARREPVVERHEPLAAAHGETPRQEVAPAESVRVEDHGTTTEAGPTEAAMTNKAGTPAVNRPRKSASPTPRVAETKPRPGKPLTTEVVEAIARACDGDPLPGEGCFNEVEVEVETDASGVLVDAKPRGRHASSTVGRCIRQKLLGQAYTLGAQLGPVVTFTCKDD
jgi:hypothetical protein